MGGITYYGVGSREKAMKKEKHKALIDIPHHTRPDSRPGAAQSSPTEGYLPPPSTTTDPTGSARTAEVNEAVALGHSAGRQKGLPSADDHVRGDLGDASGRSSQKR